MSLTFLCNNHRAWFNDNPENAFKRCVSTCEAGWTLYQQDRWHEALPYIGSAYEAAEILLVNRVTIPGSAMEWFIHTLAGLTQTLKKLERIDTCNSVYQKAIDRLTREKINSPEIETAIDAQIHQLQQEMEQLNGSGDADIQRVNAFSHSQNMMVFH
jgi:hypothetical protein